MRVRIKTWLLAAVGAAALTAIADTASAQCGPRCEPPKPPCCQPPPPPPPPPPPCCRPPVPPTYPGGGNVNVNVNVNAGASANANANANAGARAFVNARAGSFSNAGSTAGSSAYVSVEQPYPTAISGLNVEAASVAQLIRVPYSEMRRFEKRVVIQAVCIDDRNIPHPASQVRPDRDVFGEYEGELYRCIAGSRLHVTIADYLNEISFDGGETLACRKGEALWHGRGGMIECRPQKRERDCNERSLLRRYGAGIKVLTIVREELFESYREEVVEVAGASVIGGSIVLDGGVGGRVF